jgi:hypothetical protein
MTRQTIARRSFRSLVRVWAEADYAQRRLFEIQTGIRMTDRPKD